MQGTYLPGEYLPVLLFLFVAIAFGVGVLILGYLFRPHRPDPEKLSPYECGIPPISDARERLSIRFYIIGMLFLVFDVEVVFLYPWAIVYDRIGLFGFIEMVLFIAILFVGYLYAWRKGALEWE